MRLLIQTDNPFYEGWLCRVFGLATRDAAPYSSVFGESWQCGWDTANETRPDLLGMALLAEAELGRNLTIKNESKG